MILGSRKSSRDSGVFRGRRVLPSTQRNVSPRHTSFMGTPARSRVSTKDTELMSSRWPSSPLFPFGNVKEQRAAAVLGCYVSCLIETA